MSEIRPSPLRYAKTSRGIDVFLHDRHIGTVMRGAESVYFRTRAGRGKLYPNIATLVQFLMKLASVIPEKSV